jgi:hypothetical protein
MQTPASLSKQAEWREKPVLVIDRCEQRCRSSSKTTSGSSGIACLPSRCTPTLSRNAATITPPHVQSVGWIGRLEYAASLAIPHANPTGLPSPRMYSSCDLE